MSGSRNCSSGFPRLPKLAEKNNPNLFGLTHLDYRTLCSASEEDSVLLLKADARYLPNPARPKGFFAKPFYLAAADYLSEFHKLFLAQLSQKSTKFKSTGFTGFMHSKIPLTKAKQTTVIEMYLNSLKLFQLGNVDKQKMFPTQVASLQKKGLSRVRSAYFRAGGPKSTVPDHRQSRKAFFAQDL